MATKLRSREQELRRFLATGSDDLGRQVRELQVRRERLAAEAVERAGRLRAAVVAGNKSKRLIEVDKVKHEAASTIAEALRADLRESEEGLKGFQREIEEKRAAFNNAKAQMDAQKTQVSARYKFNLTLTFLTFKFKFNNKTVFHLTNSGEERDGAGAGGAGG